MKYISSVKKSVTSKFSISKDSHGFTLIEIIVVFGVMAILSSIGIASFVNYSKAQQVSGATNEIKTMLLTARSRALSQLKLGQCKESDAALEGYRVVMCAYASSCSTSCISTDDYEMQILCADPSGNGTITDVVDSQKLPTNVAIVNPNISQSSTTASCFLFNTTTGGVSTNVSSGKTPRVGISGYGITKTISVSQTGVIQ